MSEPKSTNEFFESLAQRVSFDAASATPSKLKARIYTRLLQRQAESGPLMSLTDVPGDLCIFEKIVAVAPVPAGLKRWNPCSVCHARALAEHFENAPIYWHGCPYTDFQNR